MLKVEDIQAAIESLPEEEYTRLRNWFSEKDRKQWDRQIKKDTESGKLDFIIKEAIEEKSKSR